MAATTDRYRRATRLQLEARSRAQGKSGSGSFGVSAAKSSVQSVARAMPTRAQQKARAVDIKSQPRTQGTTRGNRRLTFEQAYLRRTTDSSRARVEKLYGRTAGAGLKAKAGVADRSLPKPVTAPAGGYADKPSRPVALPRTTGSRTGTPQRGRRPRRRRRGNGTGGAMAPRY